VVLSRKIAKVKRTAPYLMDLSLLSFWRERLKKRVSFLWWGEVKEGR